jgi:hypothetical protein
MSRGRAAQQDDIGGIADKGGRTELLELPLIDRRPEIKSNCSKVRWKVR